MKQHFCFISIIIIAGIISCRTSKIEKQIKGVWIYETNDSRDDNYIKDFKQIPILLDFKRSNDVIVKAFTPFDTILSWSIDSSSILNIAESKYKVESVSKDSLKLSEHGKTDSKFVFLQRPIPHKVKSSIDEISNLLCRKNWRYNNSLEFPWAQDIEYIQNGIVLFGDSIYDRIIEDSTYYYHQNTWDIKQYKGYTFLYSIIDWEKGNGLFRDFAQITKVTDNSFTLWKNGQLIINQSLRINNQRKEELKEILVGKWVCQNFDTVQYGIPKNIRQFEHRKFYDGKIHWHFFKDSLVLKLENEKPRKYFWQISKDGNKLIIEHPFVDGRGNHIETISIISISGKELLVRLFSPIYFTEHEKPSVYQLNIFQKLIKY